jgi:OmpA-OmpF porin, OOP family
MSVNLLELLKEHLSGDVVSNLAALIGETPKSTESAVQNALPSLLAGLADKTSDTNNLAKLFDLILGDNHDGGLLSNLGALSRGGEETNKLMTGGAELLSTLFGDKLTGMTDIIANLSGTSTKSTSSLLGFISPVVLGLIGKILKLENIESAAGLGKLLSNQTGFLKGLIPAGMSGLFSVAVAGLTEAMPTDNSGESNFDKIVGELDIEEAAAHLAPITAAVSDTFDTIKDVADDSLDLVKNKLDDIGESASSLGANLVGESKDFAQSAASAFEDETEGGSKWLPWLLIAAAMALVWGLLKSCGTEDVAETPKVDNVTAPANPTQPAVVTPAPVAPESAKVEPPPAVSPTTNSFDKNLPTGYVLKAAKDGLESKLVTFIESSDPVSKDLWFTMDGVTFDTNKATIKAESMGQVTNIAEILKAFPNIKIKIGGYTDNTGKADANLKLSKNRANAVRKALIDKGTKADRVKAEGYGSEHPVASNDTEEGRQKNRRIDVNVIEK